MALDRHRRWPRLPAARAQRSNVQVLPRCGECACCTFFIAWEILLQALYHFIPMQQRLYLLVVQQQPQLEARHRRDD